MATGYLEIIVSVANQAHPIQNAMIRMYRIYDKELIYEDFFMSNEHGSTGSIALYVASDEQGEDTLEIGNHYESYHVEVRRDGFQSQVVKGVQIFAKEKSYLELSLIPVVEKELSTVLVNEVCERTFEHVEVKLEDDWYMTHQSGDVKNAMNSISVHLGKAEEDVENINIPLLSYIKNVASSCIHPTASKDFMKTQIKYYFEIITSRIQNKYYEKQGYDFDITTTPNERLLYVPNRNLYERISQMVDEVWNEYIGYEKEVLQYVHPQSPQFIIAHRDEVRRLQEQLHMIAIQYPNIKTDGFVPGVFDQCMKQAVESFQTIFHVSKNGCIDSVTRDYINSIYEATQKLVELQFIAEIQSKDDEPRTGIEFCEGSSGEDIQLLQFYLSCIALLYREIPSQCIDGCFGTQMKKSVIAFQKHFMKHVNGIIDEDTWKQIHTIFMDLQSFEDVKKKRKLDCEILPRIGDEGTCVGRIQEALAIVSTQYPNVMMLDIDHIFGENTKQAVCSFQKQFHLSDDGIVDKQTMDVLFAVVENMDQEEYASKGERKLSSVEMAMDEQSDNVRLIQSRLKEVAKVYPSIPDLEIDGVYDIKTRAAVEAFQDLMGIHKDGRVHMFTWQLLHQCYEELNH